MKEFASPSLSYAKPKPSRNQAKAPMHACSTGVEDKAASDDLGLACGAPEASVGGRGCPGRRFASATQPLGPLGPAVSVAGLALGKDAGVEQVLQKDVLDVLGADAARAQRGETGLHQEDQRTCATSRKVRSE
jgi:hypothetical protein